MNYTNISIDQFWQQPTPLFSGEFAFGSVPLRPSISLLRLYTACSSTCVELVHTRRIAAQHSNLTGDSLLSFGRQSTETARRTPVIDEWSICESRSARMVTLYITTYHNYFVIRVSLPPPCNYAMGCAGAGDVRRRERGEKEIRKQGRS